MAESTEQIILEKARQIFIQKGYTGTRMQEIADEAGINKAMLHYYYRSKEKLFQVIVEETMQGIIPKLGEALAGEESVTEKLEQVIRLYISLINENPYIPMFILHELSQNRTQFVDSIKTRVTRFPDFPGFFFQVMQEQADGKIKEIPPVHLLLNVMGMVIFPFIARPVFINLVDIPNEQYDAMMKDRADIVVAFMKAALHP